MSELRTKQVLTMAQQQNNGLDFKTMKHIAKEVGTTTPMVMRILLDNNYKLIPNN